MDQELNDVEESGYIAELPSDSSDSEYDPTDESQDNPQGSIRLYTEHNDQFVCDLCKKSFDQRRYVTRHIRKIHKATRGQHQCPICERYMMQKSDLKRHLATHTDTKEHMCPVCSKTFTRKDSMLVHKRQHSNDYTFKCDLCGRGFHSRVSLESHTRIHTGDRPFSCPTCASTFRQKGDLTRHLQSHMGIKPYNCEICNKTFGRNADLRRHMTTHEEEKPWHCSVCAKGFSRKYLYTKHMLWHEANPGVESNNNELSPIESSHPTVLQNILENKMSSEGGLATRELSLPTGEVPGFLSNLDSLPPNHGNSLQKLADRLKSKLENLKQLPHLYNNARLSLDNSISHASTKPIANLRHEYAHTKSTSRKRKNSRPTKRSATPELYSPDADSDADKPLDFTTIANKSSVYVHQSAAHSNSSTLKRTYGENFTTQSTPCGDMEPLDLSVAPPLKSAKITDSNDNIQPREKRKS